LHGKRLQLEDLQRELSPAVEGNSQVTSKAKAREETRAEKPREKPRIREGWFGGIFGVKVKRGD
jgi:hypothetical protein